MATLINLPTSEYEHPFDREALEKLKTLRGLDVVTNFFLNWAFVNWRVIELQGSCFRVTKESNKELYNLVENVAETLGLSREERPKIFTEWGYNINGYTTGNRDNTLLVLNSGAVDLLSEDQLKYIVGHEMGHIKSGHVLYHMMAQLISTAISFIPLGKNLLGPIELALIYWSRMSEFTADRAGLLACQNKDEAIKAIIKMAGYPLKYFDNINTESFIEQARDFDNAYNGIADQAIKTVTIATSTHPWTVYRASELLKWVESGEYDRIISKYGGVKCKSPFCDNILSKDTGVCYVCGTPQ